MAPDFKSYRNQENSGIDTLWIDHIYKLQLINKTKWRTQKEIPIKVLIYYQGTKAIQ